MAKRRVVNELNDLSGSEWLYWTNTVWETAYPPDPSHRLRKGHGAMKPPGAMAEIIRFFTKEGGRVVDPFAGVGGTLIGAELCGRRALGIELDPRWVAIYEEVCARFGIRDGAIVPLDGGARRIKAPLRCGDCLELMPRVRTRSVDLVLADPPYGVGHVQRFRRETNFAMRSADPRDLGNLPDLEAYLNQIRAFGREAHRILKDGKYLVVLVGDRYVDGEYVPLGTRVAGTLRQAGFDWKGLKIWWNKSTLRRLRPYAVKRSFAPNITHQNVLILKKRPPAGARISGPGRACGRPRRPGR